MSTRYFTIDGSSGTNRSEARFDVLYMAARRQHTEALRQAEMARLAHRVARSDHGGASREGRTAAAVRSVADLLARKGRSTAGSSS